MWGHHPNKDCKSTYLILWTILYSVVGRTSCATGCMCHVSQSNLTRLYAYRRHCITLYACDRYASRDPWRGQAPAAPVLRHDDWLVLRVHAFPRCVSLSRCCKHTPDVVVDYTRRYLAAMHEGEHVTQTANGHKRRTITGPRPSFLTSTFLRAASAMVCEVII